MSLQLSEGRGVLCWISGSPSFRGELRITEIRLCTPDEDPEFGVYRELREILHGPSLFYRPNRVLIRGFVDGNRPIQIVEQLIESTSKWSSDLTIRSRDGKEMITYSILNRQALVAAWEEEVRKAKAEEKRRQLQQQENE